MRLTLEQAQNKLLEAFKKLPPAEKKRMIDDLERLLDQKPLDNSAAQ